MPCVMHAQAVRTLRREEFRVFLSHDPGMKRLSDPITLTDCRHSAQPVNVTLYQLAMSDQPLTVNVGQRWRVRAAAAAEGEIG